MTYHVRRYQSQHTGYAKVTNHKTKNTGNSDFDKIGHMKYHEMLNEQFKNSLYLCTKTTFSFCQNKFNTVKPFLCHQETIAQKNETCQNLE